MDVVLHNVGVFLTLPSTVIVLAVLFGLGNATSMFLAICGIPWAWLIVICSQTLNITYLSVTHQWLVLVGGQPVCLVLGIYGLQRWLRKGVRRDPKGAKPDPQLLVGYDPAVSGGALIVLRAIRTPDENDLRAVLEELYGPALELHHGHLGAIDALCRRASASTDPLKPSTNGGGRHRRVAVEDAPTQEIGPPVRTEQV